MKIYREIETGRIIKCNDMHLIYGHEFEEVRETDTFVDLVTYGEWMPVKERNENSK